MAMRIFPWWGRKIDIDENVGGDANRVRGWAAAGQGPKWEGNGGISPTRIVTFHTLLIRNQPSVVKHVAQ